MGDNDFSVEHTGVRARQKAGTLERVVKYDQAAWDFLAASPSDDDFFFFFSQHFFTLLAWERGELRPFLGRHFFLRPFGRMVQARATR